MQKHQYSIRSHPISSDPTRSHPISSDPTRIVPSPRNLSYSFQSIITHSVNPAYKSISPTSTDLLDIDLLTDVPEVQLGVLHYRRRGRRSSIAQIRRQSLRLVPVLRVPGIRVMRSVLGRATIRRLPFPYLLAGARIRSVIIGWTLRDVVLVVMGIRDFVRLGYTELLDLVETRLAGGRARVRFRPPRDIRPPLLLLPLATLVLPVFLAPIARPVRRVAALRLPRGVVVRVILLILGRMTGRRRHWHVILCVLLRECWGSAVRVHVRGL